MNPINITGVVVCGGQSSRMGQDKSMLVYYSQPQRYHIAQLLKPFCKEVYISLNDTQEDGNENYKLIRDHESFANKGPLTALLSAYEHLPDQNFLFIGCDYPLLNSYELDLFLKSINENTKAKTFFNESENLYEPLLAYYSSDFHKDAMQYFKTGNSSLQKLLTQSNAEKHFPDNKNILKSIDDENAFKKMLKHIGNTE